MSAFETLLDEAVQRGLVGFTLFLTQDGRWQGNISFDRLSWQHRFGDTPIEAAIAVLSPRAVPQSTASEDIFG